jgi:large subunit ribosomal protein L1
MSKTTQENKAKKAKEQKKVEEITKKDESQKAVSEEKTTETVDTSQVEETNETTESTKVKTAKHRSKKYLAAKAKIDVNKYYPLKEAIKLVKKTSLSKFEGKVEAHVNIFDIGNVGEINFPHLKSISKKVVILNDTILAEIKKGKIDFDILVATPITMSKLLPLAKTLGPKGLMPNPKNGTLTEKPEDALKKLSVAKTILKTEKKAPVIHIIVGKISQKDEEIIANIEELIKVIENNKIKKLALCATIGPCVKVKTVA